VGALPPRWLEVDLRDIELAERMERLWNVMKKGLLAGDTLR
jgi:hypothetical protein